MKYTITNCKDKKIGTEAAETAIEALERYCAGHPNRDTGFSRGGLTCDSETRGQVSASIKTDGGRITATANN